MLIKSLQLYNFRIHERRDIEFEPGVTVISGSNGSGKTSILEAIYLLAYGKSFRDPDGSLVRFGDSWWRVQASYENDVVREMRYQADYHPPKTFWSDGVKRGRFSYHDQISTLLFEPNDTLLVRGSPSRRRDYFDLIACHIYPGYRTTLSRYKKTLTQRNTGLRTGQPDDLLFAWNIMLAEYGAKIINLRQQLVRDIEPVYAQVFSDISGGKLNSGLTYSCDKPLDASKLVKDLTGAMSRDRRLGYTSVGPHRDDYEFVIDAKPADVRASRGEVRSLIIALKVAERSLLERHNGSRPLILLDDVFSELDTTHRQYLIELLAGYQSIITTTNADIDHLPSGADVVGL